jgi:Holliday junction resolvase RusA-like endonuclease
MTMLPDMDEIGPPPLVIVVPGAPPVSQGSKTKAMLHRTTGQPISFEQHSAALKAWRKRVTYAARIQLAGRAGFQTGPVHVTIRFIFDHPQHHYRTGKYANMLRDNAPRLHSIKPDADKLLRSTFDALTTAGVWKDDCQVAGIAGEPIKVYANRDELPGARITIRSYQ